MLTERHWRDRRYSALVGGIAYPRRTDEVKPAEIVVKQDDNGDSSTITLKKPEQGLTPPAPKP